MLTITLVEVMHEGTINVARIVLFVAHK